MHCFCGVVKFIVKGNKYAVTNKEKTHAPYSANQEPNENQWCPGYTFWYRVYIFLALNRPLRAFPPLNVLNGTSYQLILAMTILLLWLLFLLTSSLINTMAAFVSCSSTPGATPAIMLSASDLRLCCGCRPIESRRVWPSAALRS